MWPTIKGIPVFVYHQIDDGFSSPSPSTTKYCVAAKQFQNQLGQIKRSGLSVISVSEIAERADSTVESSSVGITFDDGCASDYELAYPLLMASGFRADFFLNTANIGRPGYLNWEQIREMQRTGMAFHSHGHSHCVLSVLSPRELRREIETPRKILEDKLGCPVKFLAAPYGLLNARVIREAFRAGYVGVCNSRQWTTRIGRRCINRMAVVRHTSSGEFQRIIERRAFPYVVRSLRSAALYVPKQILLKTQPKQLGVVLSEERV